MKKKLLIGGIGVVLLGVTFFAGGLVGNAGLDWKTEVINEASARIGNAGYMKKEELLSKDMGDQMLQVLEPTLAEQEAELRRLLEEYYQLKLQGLSESPEMLALESQINTIKTNILNRYKQEIDAAFTGK